MLVAQARIEGLTLATADRALADYDVPLLLVSRES
jgi:PIN domain nuclease of toxin-antitoxin system